METKERPVNFINWPAQVNALKEQRNSGLWEYSVEATGVDSSEQSILTDFLASILIVFTVFGNVGLLVVTTWRIFGMKKKSATCLFLWNLAIADILVISMLLPFQVGWVRRDRWRAGEAACRTLAFFRSFSHYLSGFILTGISVDRYLDVHRPFLMRDSVCRAMLIMLVAWAGSVCASLAEAVLHHVPGSPFDPQFLSCTSAESYISSAEKFLYAEMKMALAGLPILVIVGCYLRILLTLRKTQADGMERHSGSDPVGQTQIRTLKLFIAISSVFLLCWMPAKLVALWFWVDLESALLISPQARIAIILLSQLSPCLNPFIYVMWV